MALYPFKLFVTWLHELSHGLVMLCVGAGFDKLEIFPDTSGLAHAKGGVGSFGRSLIACAGYMGTALAGGGLLVLGETAKGTRTGFLSIAIAMAISTLLWISNPFGWYSAGVGILFFFVMAAIPFTEFSRFTLHLVAAQACVQAFLDVRVLFRPQLVINGKIVSDSDAHTMAKVAFGSPRFWGVLWLLWCLLIWFAALKHMQKRTLQAPKKETT